MALAMGITILLFVFISSYSSIIAQEIASEKGTRIMEVILSSTKAQTHFYGKLTGVILVALTQIFIYGVAFVLGYSQLKNLDFMKSLLSGISPQSILTIFSARLYKSNVLVYSEGGMIQSLKQSISILKNEQKHK